MRTQGRGFSLPELLVALALGLLLSAAFVAVLDRGRREMSAQESLAQLQDAARQAIDGIELDLESAGFSGLSGAGSWELARNGALLASGDALLQPDAAHPRVPVGGLPAGAHDCGTNFAVDLALPVQATNNSWPPGVDAGNCAPAGVAGGVHPGSDSLTVRHASSSTVAPHVGRLQQYSRRRATHFPVTLFADGVAPGPQDADAEIRDVEVRTYYIANNSVGHPGWPALRIKSLTESGGHAQFRDEEVMPGVEDLQVEFGLADAGAPARIRFVDAGAADLRTQRLVAVRFWLRLRADTTERDYEDGRTLQYAGVNFAPDAVEVHQRRLLVERTIALRNAAVP